MVSRLSFGSLTIGPLQKGLSFLEGASIITKALAGGVNCIDTAEYYDNYEYIAPVLREYPDTVVITKSYAYDRTGAVQTVEKAQKALGRTYLDVVMLHEQESEHTLRGHEEALAAYLEMKEQGWIGQVGVSTHFVGCALTAGKMPQIDVISPLCNQEGFGIMGGTLSEMQTAIRLAHQNGKGTAIMKPLGGGHLSGDARQAFDFLLSMKEVDTIAVGMQSEAEVGCNLAHFEGKGQESLFTRARSAPRALHIADWCIRCGACVRRCKQKALSRGATGRVTVQVDRCVLCGYCAKVCPEFCIKVY